MPSKSPTISRNQLKELQALGQKLRDRRKELGINATTTAESAGMSRITLYRIEKGEASVTIGAYISVIQALGLELHLITPQERQALKNSVGQKLPKSIRITNYKQLKRLAWQLKGTQELTPQEALDLYERNWRHIDFKVMSSKEKKLLELLLANFGRKRPLV